MKYPKDQIMRKIEKKVHEIDPKAEIILFGSRARGDEHYYSDWDILILTNHPVKISDEQKFRHHLIDLEIEVEEPFSTFVYNKKEWETKHKITPFYQNIIKEGVRNLINKN